MRSWLERVGLAAVLILGVVLPARAQQKTLTVYAAASLTDAFEDIGKLFEQRHPGTRVEFNFGGSQALVFQMQQGASADVFASADNIWMGVAVDSGLTAGAPTLFARNRLVVIIPKSNPGRVDRLEHLARQGTKVVLAADAVPVGHYSRQALRNLASQPGYPADYVRSVLRNVVSNEESVKGVVSKVQLGEADAGIVYRSDVTDPVARVVRVIPIPDSLNVIAEYPMAVLKDSREKDLARQFVALVTSPEGQSVLQRYKFIPIGSAVPASTSP
ncbi:MAG TPA: molybdate ABC transporter substrate-binding protein [Gemmatimonadales bacterium]|nr:molybdate ABC transporter substrate-binding protein [Gemmatimonadales bacterium]